MLHAMRAGPSGPFRDGPAVLARQVRQQTKTLIGRLFHVCYTVEATWRLLKRQGWSWQKPALWAIERDDNAIEVWRKETWPRVRAPRRSGGLDRLRGRGRAVDDSAARTGHGRS
ncbi:winged helix-turn-helix domain-containing protein [Streptomyces fagopyri]|uniref:helix-turn-helix domain-containing protein n=1 Tax=Streptomyces fagopyri TaxID=2662397 RepID=UPI0036997D65